MIFFVYRNLSDIFTNNLCKASKVMFDVTVVVVGSVVSVVSVGSSELIEGLTFFVLL